MPLSRQAIEAIVALRTITGRGPLAFPNTRHAHKPMSENAIGWGSRLNVAVGMADLSGEQMSNSLADALGASANVLEVVRYRIGPSVGAYAGLGTVGCFMFPTD